MRSFWATSSAARSKALHSPPSPARRHERRQRLFCGGGPSGRPRGNHEGCPYGAIQPSHSCNNPLLPSKIRRRSAGRFHPNTSFNNFPYPEERTVALEIIEKELRGIIILEPAGRLVLGQES